MHITNLAHIKAWTHGWVEINYCLSRLIPYAPTFNSLIDIFLQNADNAALPHLAAYLCQELEDVQEDVIVITR